MEVIESAERIKFLSRLTSRGSFVFPRLCRDTLVSTEKLQIERARLFLQRREDDGLFWRDPYALFFPASPL
jgi:hypothetical protein